MESIQITEARPSDVVPKAKLATRKVDPLDALFEEHFEAVYRFLSRRLSNPDDAKDVAAETFAAAMIKRCPRGVAPRMWLYGIARRKLADALRKRRRHENLDPNMADPSNLEASIALRQSIEALPIKGS